MVIILISFILVTQITVGLGYTSINRSAKISTPFPRFEITGTQNVKADIKILNDFPRIKSNIGPFHKFEDDPAWVINLVDNKIDLEDQRTVSKEEAMAKAQTLKSFYIETAALHNINVQDTFKLIGIGLFFKNLDSN